MRAALPMELLMRLANATPEVYATIERLLGLNAVAMKDDVEIEPASDEVALKLFALVKALESETKYRKAPVVRVFYLYCVEGLSREQVARECRCVPSLVTLRLQAIQKKLGRNPKELRAFSSEFDRISDSLSDSRARHIDRRRVLGGEDRRDDE